MTRELQARFVASLWALVELAERSDEDPSPPLALPPRLPLPEGTRDRWLRRAAALRDVERSFGALGRDLIPRWRALRQRTLAWVRANPTTVDRYAAELADEAVDLVNALVPEPHRAATFAALAERVDAWPLFTRGEVFSVLDLPFGSAELDAWPPGDLRAEDIPPKEWAAVVFAPEDGDEWPAGIKPEDVFGLLRPAPATTCYRAAAAVVALAYGDARPDLRARVALWALVGPPPPGDDRLTSEALRDVAARTVPKDATREDVNRLADELHDRLCGLREDVGLIAEPAPDAPVDREAPDGGRLAADEAAAAFLTRPPFGAAGRDVAAPLRSGAAKRWATYRAALDAGDPPPHRARAELWRTWLPREDGTPAPIVGALAAALWDDVVAPALERARKRRERYPTPVVPRAVAELWRTPRLAETPPPEWQDAGADLWATAVTHEALARFFRALRTPAAERLWRWIVWQAQQGVDRADLDGGIPALCERIGARSHKDQETVREVLRYLDAARLPVPGFYQGRVWLLGVDDIPPAPGRRALLRLTFNDPIRPGFWRQIIGRGGLYAEARRLEPVLKPDELPPPATRRAGDYGPLCTLQGLIVREFADRSDLMAAEGSVPLPPARLAELLTEAGVRRTLDGDTILCAWTRPGTADLFPVLESPEPDRYRLAYQGAQRCIESVGRYRLKQSRNIKRRKGPRKGRS